MLANGAFIAVMRWVSKGLLIRRIRLRGFRRMGVTMGMSPTFGMLVVVGIGVSVGVVGRWATMRGELTRLTAGEIVDRLSGCGDHTVGCNQQPGCDARFAGETHFNSVETMLGSCCGQGSVIHSCGARNHCQHNNNLTKTNSPVFDKFALTNKPWVVGKSPVRAD